MLILAAVSHVIGTAASYAMGIFGEGRIVDVGHAVLPARPDLRAWVEVLTFAIPFAIGTRKSAVPSLATFAIATFLRGISIALTVLPPLLPPSTGFPDFSTIVVGHGYDYVFSGHAAFAASWILESPGRLAYALGAVQAAGLIACRMHYSVDVFLAWILTWLVHAYIASRPPPEITLRYVALTDLDAVARLRHAVYAEELGQYDVRSDGRLPDFPDPDRVLIGAFAAEYLAGYVGVTMPGGKYSLESHGFSSPPHGAYELRALCVDSKFRNAGVATALMHAALRFAKSSGGEDVEIVAMAREELVDVYERRGMETTGEDACVRAVRYLAVRGKPEDPGVPPSVVWALPYSDRAEAPCFHGGASLAASHRSDGVSADVLDAWYDPSLAAQAGAGRDSAWAMRTSAPTNAEPLIRAIADSRGVACENIAVGAGSSELIFRCFAGWLTKASRVLLVEPTYGEYPHVLRNVIGCTVDSLELHESEGFRLNANRLWDRCAETRYDLVVLVNPNSPTGTHCAGLENVLPHLGTRVWVDETYVEYVGGSLERVAARSPNVIVCKSMSKVYALSGCRVGYVCGHPSQIGTVRARTPPWIVGRSTQAAAIEAVRDVEYYADRIRETHAMRETLERKLGEIPGVRVFPGCANWTLVKLPVNAGDVVRRCADRGVYLRDAGNEFCRIAVRREIDEIVETLRAVLDDDRV
jgi:histidinol-phosphate/aromatic aminotransferase/cobyric acid decarboxylase-like protein/ribosomal protein S18 acetylase RimI-like enzyme